MMRQPWGGALKVSRAGVRVYKHYSETQPPAEVQINTNVSYLLPRLTQYNSISNQKTTDMKALFFAFPMLILCMTACSNEDEPRLPYPIDPQYINFQEPEVGQFNEYELKTYTCGATDSETMSVIKWEVTEVTESEVEIRETNNGTEVATFTADRLAEGWSISAEERIESNMLFFYGDDLIRVNAPTTADVQQQGCVFFDGSDKFVGEYVARAAEFNVGDFELRDMKVVSCVPTILDLDGYLLYNDYTLWASFSASNFLDEPTVRAFFLK